MIVASPLPAVIAARTVHVERDIAAQLQGAMAVSPDTAIVVDLPTPLHRRRLARLEGLRVVIANDERHYLDEYAWTAYQFRRRRRAQYVLSALGWLLFLGLVVGWLTR